MTFLATEKKRQLAWKLTSKALPREARVPGLYRSRMYPFCLPLELADYNLFHEIRDEALATFARLGIVWHGAALPGLPSNHLCSSQVFCVNALFPFVHRPEALAGLLKPHFPDLARMLPIEEDYFVSFEWIGEHNYLGEIPRLGTERHRGAGSTSIDAAMLYEAEDGRRVMILAEWKYSESYGAAYKRFRSDGSDRVESYREIFFGPFTPIDLTVAPRLEDFLFEPAYQLCRQQLLASRIIELGEPAVDEVVLVHIAVSENRELRNVTSPRLRELGRDLYTLWPSLLVEPSTFKLISTEELFKNLPTDRYPELEPWEHYMRSRYSFLK